jgi:hypothetical protein
MKTYYDILTELSDNLFEANNHLTTEKPSAKIEKLPGEPGTKERIEVYRKNVELGLTIEGKPIND